MAGAERDRLAPTALRGLALVASLACLALALGGCEGSGGNATGGGGPRGPYVGGAGGVNLGR